MTMNVGPVHMYTTTEEFEKGDITLKTHQMFSVHTPLEEFENRVFTLKTHQMFSVHTPSEKFKKATITGHFGFGQENHLIIVTSSFSKLSVLHV